ncbi:hypothetical protein Ancab_034003 [Ancistrocladus abbreviatus]
MQSRKKSRLDVARLLISTDSAHPISSVITVKVEAEVFPIRVFEESSGDTIFSRGSDRVVHCSGDVGKEEGRRAQSDWHSGSEDSPRTFDGPSDRGGEDSPATIHAKESEVCPSGTMPNDGFRANRGATASPTRSGSATSDFRESKSGLLPSQLHVTSPARIVETPLMEEATGETDWSEREKRVDSSEGGDLPQPPRSAPIFMPVEGVGPESNWAPNRTGKGFFASLEANSGLSALGPLLASPCASLRPDKEKTKSKARKTPKRPKKSKSLLNSSSEAELKNSCTVHRQREEDTVLFGISIRDSNIENRNRVILGTMNQVSAEEIWEVGKRLGVHSEEEDRHVVQRIAKTQL